MVQTATALLASGQTGIRLARADLAGVRAGADGAVPQNSWINGDAYWSGTNWMKWPRPFCWPGGCSEPMRCGMFDPWPLVSRAARYLLLHGPVTGQERWEENSGYSPSTLARSSRRWFAPRNLLATARKPDCGFSSDYADWLSAHVEEWTVTTAG